MAKPDHKLDEEPLEPEILDPSDEEITRAKPASALLDRPEPDGRIPADTHAVVPVTGLQQYLAEIRRYPYL